MEISDLILKHALHNAASFGGKASSGAVMGKVLAEQPDAKSGMGELGKLVTSTIAKVNSMSPAEQKELLEKNFSGFSEERAAALDARRKKDSSGERELPPLPGDTGAVRMRMAPYPSGPLHIGNARMAVLNDEYVKRYGGKLVLYFDDTVGTETATVETADGVKTVASKSLLPEAYDLIPESLRWLGVEWHETRYKSDNVERFYDYTEKLLAARQAYVCTCDAVVFRREFKEKKIACPCRELPAAEQDSRWKKMLDGSMRAGEAVVRIKSGIDHPNPAMRDHVIMRITEREHPRVGRKYQVWPLLEFSWGIDDHLIGSTHILRGADLVKEDWVEEIVWDFFGWRHAEFLHYGKFRLEEGAGTISKSKSKDAIARGEFAGWDDPRTWSLQSLARRGIRAEAVRKFLLSFGMSLVDVAVEPEILYGMNRELIDPVSNRYFLVTEPAELTLAADASGEAPLHPDFPERGVRRYSAKNGDAVLIEKKDLPFFEKGAVRLKGLGTFELDGAQLAPSGKQPAVTIQFVLKKEALPVRILMPDGTRLAGLAEKATASIKPGETIQFERFAFCRKDGESEYWVAHK